MEARRIVPPPFAFPAAVAPVVPPDNLDGEGRLIVDVSCRKCGYNLRGLSTEGRCPECGTAVGRSLQGDFLRFADPDWVQTLASGMNWIVAGIVLGFVLGFLAAGVIGFMAVGRASSGGLTPGRADMLGTLAGMLTGAVALVGYWKVTTPDPSGIESDSGITARKLVRFCQAANYLLGPVSALSAFVSGVLVMAVTGVSGILGVIAIFATFVYARRLALRLPNDKLASHCRIIMWGIAATMILASIAGIIALASAGGGPAAVPAGGGAGAVGMVGAAAVGCFVAVGWTVFGLWSLLLIDRFRKALRHAAATARATWAVSPSSSGSTA